MLIYVITNLVDIDSLDSVSTEDELYIMENLYNKRPSKPFRFTDQDDEWIKVYLGTAGYVTFAGIFNHNFMCDGDTVVRIEAADADFTPGTGAEDEAWDMECCEENACLQLSGDYPWWALYVDDPNNNVPEIGEFVLGVWANFNKAYVQPGREDGPYFRKTGSETHWGQNWDAYLSEGEEFSFRIKTINANKCDEDELQTFIKEVQQAGGKFIYIPDDDCICKCYYVRLAKTEGFAARLVYGDGELREWAIPLRTLVTGIEML